MWIPWDIYGMRNVLQRLRKSSAIRKWKTVWKYYAIWKCNHDRFPRKHTWGRFCGSTPRTWSRRGKDCQRAPPRKSSRQTGNRSGWRLVYVYVTFEKSFQILKIILHGLLIPESVCLEIELLTKYKVDIIPDSIFLKKVRQSEPYSYFQSQSSELLLSRRKWSPRKSKSHIINHQKDLERYWKHTETQKMNENMQDISSNVREMLTMAGLRDRLNDFVEIWRCRTQQLLLRYEFWRKTITSDSAWRSIKRMSGILTTFPSRSQTPQNRNLTYLVASVNKLAE